MKSIFTILLAAIYFITNTGFIVNTHYCMGEVANVSVGSSSTASCGKCGMENKGCCHDDPQIVKLTVDHQLSSIQPEAPKQVVFASQEFLQYYTVQYYSIVHLKEPDYYYRYLKSSRNILYCVFRI